MKILTILSLGNNFYFRNFNYYWQQEGAKILDFFNFDFNQHVMIQRKGYSLNFSLISNFVIAITINEHYCYYYSTNTIAIIIVSIG